MSAISGVNPYSVNQPTITAGYLRRHNWKVVRNITKKTMIALIETVGYVVKASGLFFVSVLGFRNINPNVNEKLIKAAKEFKNITQPFKELKDYCSITSKQTKFIKEFVSKLDDIRDGHHRGGKTEVLISLAGLINTIGITADASIISVDLVTKLISLAENVSGIKELFNWIDVTLPGFSEFIKNIPLGSTAALLWVGVVANAVGIPLAALDVKDRNKMIKDLEKCLGIGGFAPFSESASNVLTDETVKKGLGYLGHINTLQQIDQLRRAVVLDKYIDLNKLTGDLEFSKDRCRELNEMKSRLKRAKKHQIIKTELMDEDALKKLIKGNEKTVAVGFVEFDGPCCYKCSSWDSDSMQLDKITSEGFAKIIKNRSMRTHRRILKPKNLLEAITTTKACELIFNDDNQKVFDDKFVQDIKLEVDQLVKLKEDVEFAQIMVYGDVETALSDPKITITKEEKKLYKTLFKLLSADQRKEAARDEGKLKEYIQKAKFLELKGMQPAKELFSAGFLKNLDDDNKILDSVRGLIPDNEIKRLIDRQKLFDLCKGVTVLTKEECNLLYKDIKEKKNEVKANAEGEITKAQEDIKKDNNIKLSSRCIDKIPKEYLKAAGAISTDITSEDKGVKNVANFRGKVLLESLRYRLKKQRNMQVLSIVVQICATAILLAKVVLGAALLSSGGWTIAFAIALIALTAIPIIQKVRTHYILKKADKGVLDKNHMTNLQERLKYCREKSKQATDGSKHKRMLDKKIKKLEKEIRESVKFDDKKLIDEKLKI